MLMIVIVCGGKKVWWMDKKEKNVFGGYLNKREYLNRCDGDWLKQEITTRRITIRGMNVKYDKEVIDVWWYE